MFYSLIPIKEQVILKISVKRKIMEKNIKLPHEKKIIKWASAIENALYL